MRGPARLIAGALHSTPRAQRLLLTAALAVACSEPTAPELEGCEPAFAAVRDTMAARLGVAGLDDAALVVRHEGRVVCRLSFGAFRPDGPVEIASAAKWLTAATVLTVMDRGLLALDSRAGDHFPDAPAATADITVIELLSHTSGLLWFSRCMGRRTMTLQTCAAEILEGDSHFAPGEGFFYAGPPFTVAGGIAERASGDGWHALFGRAMAAPLELRNTSYGDNPNPALSEGAVTSSADDYGRFAQMILDGGVYRGRRVLSVAAVAAMRTNHSAGVPIVSSPRGDTPYGLGAWLDEQDAGGLGTVVSSPGVGGFVPLVDFPRRLVFVFQAQDEIARAWPVAMATLAAARAVVDAGP